MTTPPLSESAVVQDLTQEQWHIALTWSPGGDVAQVATVNLESNFVFPPERMHYGEKGEIQVEASPEPFDGWRVTLDKAGVGALIGKLQEIYDNMREVNDDGTTDPHQPAAQRPAGAGDA